MRHHQMRFTMLRMCTLIVVLGFASAARAAYEQGESDPRARFAVAMSRAKRDQVPDRLRADLKEILDLAQAIPNDRDAVPALEFVVMADYAGAMNQQEEAIRLLERDHLLFWRMGNYCEVLTDFYYGGARQTPQAQGRLSSWSDEPLSCRANTRQGSP